MSYFSFILKSCDYHAPYTFYIHTMNIMAPGLLFKQDMSFRSVWVISSSSLCCVVVLFLLPVPTSAAAAFPLVSNFQHKFTPGRSSAASAFGRDRPAAEAGVTGGSGSCSQPGAVSHSESSRWCRAALVAEAVQRKRQLHVGGSGCESKGKCTAERNANCGSAARSAWL